MLENKYVQVGELSIEIENAALAAGETFARMEQAKFYSERPNMISRQEFERKSAQAKKRRRCEAIRERPGKRKM